MAVETIQCRGGNGYINDFPAGCLLRGANLCEIGADASEIRRMPIGRGIYGDAVRGPAYAGDAFSVARSGARCAAFSITLASVW